MIIGLATLLITLFGAGGFDIFLINEVDSGIKKYVTDKERKKELQNSTKVYEKAIKEYNKQFKSHLKELEQKNNDKSTSTEWYEEFFKSRIAEIEKKQAFVIDRRIMLQEKLLVDEWEKIMSDASDATKKQKKEEQKKAMKKKDKELFDSQKHAVNQYIANQDKRSKVLNGLSSFEKKYYTIGEGYDKLNVSDAIVLKDKNATREDLIQLGNTLNTLRKEMYMGYLDFLLVLKENTNVEEYSVIIKKLNKALV